MKRYLIVHYGELGLKKSNKPYFVNKLRTALRRRLQERFSITYRIRHSLSRFFILLEDDFVEEEYVEVLSKISGIKTFMFCYESSVDLSELGDDLSSVFPSDIFERNDSPRTFRVKCKRSMKLEYSSVEAERKLGAHVLKNHVELPVSLRSAEFTLWVEFLNDHSYFAFKKYQGPAGMPCNSQGKMVALLSSGIDSPVAAYQMMRRGVRVIFVHFHAYPYTDPAEMDQVKDLSKILSQYQFDSKLYLIPFGEIQKAIASVIDIPARYRTLLYRRMMLRIAQEIARKEQAKGLITGDSLGQVASQTPENLYAVHAASLIPLFQPLISFDKEDVIKIAERIGTFEVSKLPCKDSCTMFSPKKPELRANVYDLDEFERLYPVESYVGDSVSKAEVIML